MSGMRFSLKKILFLAVVSILSATGASAQFTIQQYEEEKEIEPQITLMPLPEITLQGTYFDPAAWRAQKQKERKERNTIEFNSKLSTSLQRYEKWSASVDNNFAMEAVVFFKHTYKKNKFSMEYIIDGKYGMTVVSDPKAASTRDNFYKNKDELKINFQMGWPMHSNWSYSATSNLRTQFTEGYPSRTDNTLISNFMAPGYFDVAVGFTFKKKDNPFRVTISPLSGSVTTVWDRRIWDSVADGGSKYGVKKGERVTGHIGPSAEVYFDKQFGKKKNYRFRSTLYAFTSYSSPWQTPLVRWDNTFEMRISRFITASVYAQAYYKKEDKDWIQYQYAFTVGLSYMFKNK